VQYKVQRGWLQVNLSLVILLFLFFFAFGQCGHNFCNTRFKLLQTLVLASENSFLPHEHFVELAVGNKHLIEATQVLGMMVHDTKNPEAVVHHCFDGVTIQGKTLKIIKFVQFLRLIQVRDVVTMHVERLEQGELLEVNLDCLKVVVRQVQPDKVL